MLNSIKTKKVCFISLMWLNKFGLINITKAAYNFYLIVHCKSFSICSFLSAYRIWYFNTCSNPIVWYLSNTSMDPVLSWIILFLLWNIWSFSSLFVFFFVNSHTFSSKNSTLVSSLMFFNDFWVHHFFLRFLIIERRSKININIGIYDANCIVLIFWIYLKDVNIKFIIKGWYCNSISFM